MTRLSSQHSHAQPAGADNWVDTLVFDAVADANAELVRRVNEEAAAATALPRWWPWGALLLAIAVVSASAWWPMHWWGGA